MNMLVPRAKRAALGARGVCILLASVFGCSRFQGFGISTDGIAKGKKDRRKEKQLPRGRFFLD